MTGDTLFGLIVGLLLISLGLGLIVDSLLLASVVARVIARRRARLTSEWDEDPEPTCTCETPHCLHCGCYPDSPAASAPGPFSQERG